MNFIKEIKEKIGNETFTRLEDFAQKEIFNALSIELEDQYGKENYYRQTFLLPKLQKECEIFCKAGLTVAPSDIINILFKCKILHACKTEEEYDHRCGGVSFVDEYSFVVPWERKEYPLDLLIEEYSDRLRGFIEEKILISEINSFRLLDNDLVLRNQKETSAQEFFENLFIKLQLPFHVFLEEATLVEKHKALSPNHRSHTQESANKFFKTPSFGHTHTGSETHCYLYSMAWLRTFFNLLRISSFIYPHQIDKGQDGVFVKAPTSPVFLGTGSTGGYCWNEDEKEFWMRTPDGCLFLSFGYRGLSDMWLDFRTFGGIEKIFTEYKQIFNYLENPWSDTYVSDIAPTLEMLSNATQTLDIGTKILLIYGCLESLFVPKGEDRNNKKHIEGGISALRPDLLVWFKDFYKLRCEFAHKGYTLSNKQSLSFIMESMNNALFLLKIKLMSSKKDQVL